MSSLIPILIEADIYEDVTTLDADICDSKMLYEADVGVSFSENTLPTYTGETEFTPTTQTQVVQTKNKSVMDNITIDPIPNNYGLITWNGSVLTVS